MLRRLAPLLASALLAAPVAAQDVAITNARVDGHAEPVTVVVRDGKVRRVTARPGILPPDLPRVDARGGRVAPGRIDAWAGVAGGHPLGRGLDGFDPFAEHAIRGALARGVTAVCLVPRRGNAVAGTASVVKLGLDRPLVERVVREEAAVCADLGGEGRGPLERATRWGALDAALAEAGRYRDAWLEYEEAVAEYAKQLGDAAAVDSRARAGKGGERTTPEEAPKEEGEAGAARPERPRPRRRGRPGPPAEGGKPDAGKEAKGGEEGKKPEKPKRPPLDRQKALLVRVLEGELPLWLEAWRSEDLANALELVERFGVRIVLAGAGEAHRLADALAAAEVSVVLGETLRAEASGGRPREFAPGEGAPRARVGWEARDPVRHLASTAALLAERGVPLAIGTGSWDRSRHAGLNAELAAGAGLDPLLAEAAVTSAAARLLGLGERLGRVAPGYDADLVIYAADPAGPGLPPAVERVYVDGRLAWRREAP